MNKQQIQLACLMLVAASSIAFAAYLWGIGFATNDDPFLQLLARTQPLEGMASLAAMQGRYTYLVQLPIAYLPHFFAPGEFIYSLINVGSLLMLAGVLSLSLMYLGKGAARWKESLLFFVLLLSFWMNGWEHNMLASYPLFFPVLFSMALVGLYFFDCYLLGKGKGFLFLSLILFFLSMNEYVLQYSFFPVLLIWLRRHQSQVTKSALWAFIAFILVYLTLYFLFRAVFGSDYKGNHFNLDPVASFKTLIQFSLSGFPGYPLFSNNVYQAPFFPEFNFVLAVKVIAISACILCLPRSDKNSGVSPLFLLIALSCVFVPNFLISLSQKYQQWSASGVESYMSSHMSYVSWVVLFVGIFSFVERKVYTPGKLFIWRFVFLFVLIVLLLPLESWNQKVKQEMKYNLSRWQLMDQLLVEEQFQALPDNSFIYAPSLIDHRKELMIANGGAYWSAYIKNESGLNVSLFSQYWRVEAQGFRAGVPLYYLDFSRVLKGDNYYLLLSSMKSSRRNKQPDTNEVFVLLKEPQKLQLTLPLENTVFRLDGEQLDSFNGSSSVVLPKLKSFTLSSDKKFNPHSLKFQAAP